MVPCVGAGVVGDWVVSDDPDTSDCVAAVNLGVEDIPTAKVDGPRNIS